MGINPLRRTKARRAMNATPEAKLEEVDPALGTRSLIAHGLAALAISTLGLGTIGAVNLASTAQANHVDETRVEGTGNPDTSRAEPEVAAQEQRLERAAAQQEEQEAGESENGSLEVFDRSATEASRNAVRNELDRAMADKRAAERSSSLVQTNEDAFDESGKAVQDARSNKLIDNDEAIKREQARLEEEKKKAEKALKDQRAEGEAQEEPGALPPMPKSSSGGIKGKAATPVSPGGYSLSARWGAVGSWSRYHTGVDLAAPVGTPLRAAADGVVIPANGGGWAGTHVVIRHSDGSATLYAHMSGASVSPGQTVKAGQPIGAVGMTGRTFGPHLHFEHYPNASTVGDPYTTDDPARWLMGLGVNL